MKIVALALFVTFLAAVIGSTQIAAQTPDTSEPAAQQEEPTEAPAEEPTEAPAATDAPVEEGPVDEAPPGEEVPPGEEEPAEGDEDDGDNTWLIVLAVIAAIVGVIGLAGLLFGRRGSTSATAAAAGEWDSRASATYGKAAGLHDTVAGELASSTPLSDDAAARQRWQEFQRRIDDLTADLHILETQPKNEQAAGTIRGMLATLTALRPSMVAPAAMAPPAPGQPAASENIAAVIRQRLADFDADVRAFRTFV